MNFLKENISWIRKDNKKIISESLDHGVGQDKENLSPSLEIYTSKNKKLITRRKKKKTSLYLTLGQVSKMSLTR